ncbi:MAG: aspartate kinase [Clostridiaceae bacterium]|nr:aspartate kinase [Clostridiaceae bacterium]
MNVVHKYGGTSVATAEKIKAVADRVAEIKKAGNNIAVVASAMGKTTNQLIELAKTITGSPSKRELDALMSTGEQTTVALIAMALQERGVPAVSLTGFQCGFITDEYYSKATILDIDSTRLEQIIADGKVPVITGFQGITPFGDITTLGRGGSDTTAVAVAAKLGWDCEIYTDVDGIFTIDPRKCEKAKKLAKISCDEMMELSAMGAGVLETRSVELAKKYSVNLYLGRSLEIDKAKGTYVVNKYFEDVAVTGIGVMEDCAMVSVRCPFGSGMVSRIFAEIARLNINVDMISQQQINENTNMLSFSCSSESADKLAKIMKAGELPYEFTIMPSLAKISLVGAGMVTHSGVAAKAFETLYDAGVEYYQITTSEISISMTIDKENLQKACEVLTKAFELCEE